MSEKYGIGGEALIFSKIFMGEQGKITFSRNSSCRGKPIFLGGKTHGRIHGWMKFNEIQFKGMTKR